MVKLIKFSLLSQFDAAAVLSICWTPVAAPAVAVSGRAGVQEKTTTSQEACSSHPQSKCVLANFKQLFI